jgi:hypothetical protein
MKSLAGRIAIGVLCAIPVALLAGWFATVVLDPTAGGPTNVMNQALGLGPIRGIAFGAGALIAAAIVAPRLAREDLGGFGGLLAFTGLAHLVAFAGIAFEIAARDPGALDASILFTWPVRLIVSFGASLIVWLPAAAIWVAAIRRLTIEDQPVPTDLERAESERMRGEAARAHVTVDATTLADQGSRLYRNRG